MAENTDTSRFTQWPWAILSRQFDPDVLVNEYPCCMDASFTEPLVSRVENVEDFESLEFDSMVRELRRTHIKAPR